MWSSLGQSLRIGPREYQSVALGCSKDTYPTISVVQSREVFAV